jgi:hypothetical protein
MIESQCGRADAAVEKKRAGRGGPKELSIKDAIFSRRML